jgi:AAHS family 4-hydroxybenzoate transporter-like MFS transporter
MSPGKAMEISDLIDGQKIGRFQITIMAWCFAVVFMDGFDTQSIGAVAPVLAKSLGFDKATLGPVFGAGLFGLMLGCILCGPLADWFGRKKTIIGCTIAFGLISLLTTKATSLNELLVFRFFTGIGLGGALPNAIALVSEYAPKRRQATMVTVMACGFSIGAACGGLIASKLLLPFGWTSMFYIGGIMPLALVPFLILGLPESIRLLVLRKAPTEQITALLQRLNPNLPLNNGTYFTVREENVAGFPLKLLFKEGRAALTSLLWAAFALNYAGLYFLQSWLTTIISNSGVPVEDAAVVLAMFQFGATVGAIVSGRLSDRFGFYSVLGVTFVAASVSIALIGLIGASFLLMASVVFAAGFCVVGGQFGGLALAGALYPTLIRSTGVGWALGIGRLGSVIGPVLGGELLALRWPMSQLFPVAAIPSLGAAGAIFLMSRLKTPPQPELAEGLLREQQT